MQINHEFDQNGSYSKQIIKEACESLFTQPLQIELRYPLLSNFHLISQQMINENIKIAQIKVYQQHIYNYCGYHSLYNAINFIDSIKQQKIKNNFPESSVQFWQFVFKIQRFLKTYRDNRRIDCKVQPWRDQDIQHGDFERCYLMPCLQHYPEIHSIIRSEQIFNIEYEIGINVIYYQFNNIINSQQELEHIAMNIEQFQQNVNENKINIQVFLMGITYHWFTLIAIKSSQGNQFFILDSKNTPYFIWSKEEIINYINEQSQLLVKQGKQPYKPYEIEVYAEGMQDAQKITQLIVSFLLGELDILEYYNNQQTFVYINPLLEYLNVSINQIDEIQYQDCLEIIKNWAVEYKHTIFSILKSQDSIPQKSQEALIKIFKILKYAKEKYSEEECFSLYQIYNIIEATIENCQFKSTYVKQKQINLYFDNAIQFEHNSLINDMKKIYFQDFKTKRYYFVIRLQMLENIFHPQGGGQPDDEGWIILNGIEYKIVNMRNDRQHLEVYVDVLYNEQLFIQLRKCRENQIPILTRINRELRIMHSKIHSAGHLIQMVLQDINKNVVIQRGHHFPQESYLQFDIEGQILLKQEQEQLRINIQNKINQILSLSEIENCQILNLNHQETLRILNYIPEFVLHPDQVRMIKLFQWDKGYPCYGTHVSNLKQIGSILLDQIEFQNDSYKIHYQTI